MPVKNPKYRPRLPKQSFFPLKRLLYICCCQQIVFRASSCVDFPSAPLVIGDTTQKHTSSRSNWPSRFSFRTVILLPTFFLLFHSFFHRGAKSSVFRFLVLTERLYEINSIDTGMNRSRATLMSLIWSSVHRDGQSASVLVKKASGHSTSSHGRWKWNFPYQPSRLCRVLPLVMMRWHDTSPSKQKRCMNMQQLNEK